MNMGPQPSGGGIPRPQMAARLALWPTVAHAPTDCALVLDASDFDVLSLLEMRGGRLAEAEAAAILAQCTGALAHLHESGWAHRDVKPEHITLCGMVPAGAPPHARLVDFGDAARCERGSLSLSGFHGTPLYMAVSGRRDARIGGGSGEG